MSVCVEGLSVMESRKVPGIVNLISIPRIKHAPMIHFPLSSPSSFPYSCDRTQDEDERTCARPPRECYFKVRTVRNSIIHVVTQTLLGNFATQLFRKHNCISSGEALLPVPPRRNWHSLPPTTRRSTRTITITRSCAES